MSAIWQKYDHLVTKICNLFSSSIVQVISFILYKIMVDIIYLLYSGRTGAFGIEISVPDIISSYLCVILFSYFISVYTKENRISSLLMIVINMIYFVPITTYCSWGPGSSSFLFFAIIYWWILSVLQVKVPVVALKRSNTMMLDRVFYLLFAGIAFLTIYLSVKYTGFRIMTNLFDVYEVRAEAANYNLPGWLSYLQNFSTILIPLLILLAFHKKKYLFVIGGCFLLILNFSFAGHKSVIFMGALLVMGYLFYRNEMISLIVPGGILAGIATILEERILHTGYINSLLFRRQGYLLAKLSDQYYRFFRSHPTDLFRRTFLGKLNFDSPYSLDLSKIIGNNYSTQVIKCNNGLLADVWAHTGTIGILLLPIILIVCFRLFDMASDRLDTRFLIGLGVYYAVGFANATWSTVLLTHGFLIACMVFFLFPREKNIR